MALRFAVCLVLQVHSRMHPHMRGLQDSQRTTSEVAATKSVGQGKAQTGSSGEHRRARQRQRQQGHICGAAVDRQRQIRDLGISTNML
jgi:hypothetical protein